MPSDRRSRARPVGLVVQREVVRLPDRVEPERGRLRTELRRRQPVLDLEDGLARVDEPLEPVALVVLEALLIAKSNWWMRSGIWPRSFFSPTASPLRWPILAS